MTLRLTHVRLLVSDFQKMLAFYRDTLGLPVTLEVPGDIYAELDAGDATLALYRRDLMADVVGTASKPVRPDSQDDVALIFAVDNVDEAYERLKERGVAFVVGPTDRTQWVLRTAHFRDPEGNLIEIYHSLHQP